MKVFMDATGRKYVSESDVRFNAADSELPVCTQQLYDILSIAKQPLTDEQIAACQTAIACAVPDTSNNGDSNVS